MPASMFFGVRCTFVVLSVVTMWTGQMKSQVWTQVVMHRARWPAESEAVGCRPDSLLSADLCFIHANLRMGDALK